MPLKKSAEKSTRLRMFPISALVLSLCILFISCAANPQTVMIPSSSQGSSASPSTQAAAPTPAPAAASPATSAAPACSIKPAPSEESSTMISLASTPVPTPKPTAKPTAKATVVHKLAPRKTPLPTVKPTPKATASPAATSSSVSNGLKTQESKMIALVNAEREKAGLKALKFDSTLRAGALKHSNDMSSNQYFSHTSPTYGSFTTRLSAAHISYTSAGENIAMYGSVEKAHAALMNSDGHRANILNSKFTRVGIGIVYNKAKGLYYITQWFAK